MIETFLLFFDIMLMAAIVGLIFGIIGAIEERKNDIPK